MDTMSADQCAKRKRLVVFLPSGLRDRFVTACLRNMTKPNAEIKQHIQNLLLSLDTNTNVSSASSPIFQGPLVRVQFDVSTDLHQRFKKATARHQLPTMQEQLAGFIAHHVSVLEERFRMARIQQGLPTLD